MFSSLKGGILSRKIHPAVQSFMDDRAALKEDLNNYRAPYPPDWLIRDIVPDDEPEATPDEIPATA